MKRRIPFLLVSLLMMLFSCGEAPQTNEYNLVPQPNQLTPQEGRFQLSNGQTVQVPAGNAAVKAIADSLAARLQRTAGLQLSVTDDAAATAPITFQLVKGLGKEAYQLSVTPSAITLRASQPNGFFYGVQTLYQLLPAAVYGKTLDTQAHWSVPAVEIEDAPRFSYRGLMLDVCRHYAPVEYIYKFIDVLAMNKMNIFHWHLTDDQGWRIEIKKYPKLTEIGSKRKETLIDYYYVNYPMLFNGQPHEGYYTQEQIKDIVAYAASKYITVVPEIEMPGHALAAIAAYPELSCEPNQRFDVGTKWGVFEQVYCPSERTFSFLEDVIDEVVELFPSEYIHVGGDECPKTAWKKSAFCQQLIRQLGLKDDTTPSKIDGRKHTKEEKLQSYFITRMEKYINTKGKNIIGWDEILEGGLAPNATVMSWRGVEGGLTAAKNGHNAIMTPTPYAYLDFYQEDPAVAPVTIGGYTTLKKTYSYNPVPDDADSLAHKHIIGVQGNIWREYMTNTDLVDYQAFPRGMAIAETGWTLHAQKDFSQFCQRMVGAFERMEVMGVKACRNFFEVNVHTHRIEEGTLMARLECFHPEAEIHYTTDGSEPTPASPLYTEPFMLTGNIDLKAAAFLNEMPLGKTIHKPLYGNLLAGRSYQTNLNLRGTGDTFDANDVMGGDTLTFGLTNGKRGNGASYNPWCRVNIPADQWFEITFPLGETTTVEKVVFGSLFNPGYRALPAGKVIVEVSTDGQHFTEVAQQTLKHDTPETGRVAFTDTVTFDCTPAAYLRLKLQNGGTLRNGVDYEKDNGPAVLQATLFLDEIEAY